MKIEIFLSAAIAVAPLADHMTHHNLANYTAVSAAAWSVSHDHTHSEWPTEPVGNYPGYAQVTGVIK